MQKRVRSITLLVLGLMFFSMIGYTYSVYSSAHPHVKRLFSTQPIQDTSGNPNGESLEKENSSHNKSAIENLLDIVAPTVFGSGNAGQSAVITPAVESDDNTNEDNDSNDDNNDDTDANEGDNENDEDESTVTPIPTPTIIVLPTDVPVEIPTPTLEPEPTAVPTSAPTPEPTAEPTSEPTPFIEIEIPPVELGLL